MIEHNCVCFLEKISYIIFKIEILSMHLHVYNTSFPERNKGITVNIPHAKYTWWSSLYTITIAEYVDMV